LKEKKDREKSLKLGKAGKNEGQTQHNQPSADDALIDYDIINEVSTTSSAKRPQETQPTGNPAKKSKATQVSTLLSYVCCQNKSRRQRTGRNIT